MRTMLKTLALSAVVSAVCLSLVSAASAMSLQVRGGMTGGDNGDGTNIGVDVFFYEGKSFDFFVGYDLISASDTYDLSTTGGPVSATTEADTSALILGMRYKMQTQSSWKPFFSVGLALLNTSFTLPAGLESYYETPAEKDSTGLRLGLGVDVGISDTWSLGFEGSLLTNVPYYEEGWFGSARVLDTYGTLWELDLGLRYHFF